MEQENEQEKEWDWQSWLTQKTDGQILDRVEEAEMLITEAEKRGKREGIELVKRKIESGYGFSEIELLNNPNHEYAKGARGAFSGLLKHVNSLLQSLEKGE